ncbi:MAG: DUF1858 domain-containing protein [Candidatus Nealsonbacteria bacterium]
MQKITKEMTIAEVIDNFPTAATILMGFGHHCTGCPAAEKETIGDLARNNQMDLAKFLKDLNNAIKL